VQRTWQHLNFFEHATTLRARVPCIKTAGGSVKNAPFPWARTGSGFTLLLEAYLLLIAKVMPVTEVSKQTKDS
jgi:transposase